MRTLRHPLFNVTLGIAGFLLSPNAFNFNFFSPGAFIMGYSAVTDSLLLIVLPVFLVLNAVAGIMRTVTLARRDPVALPRHQAAMLVAIFALLLLATVFTTIPTFAFSYFT